MKEEPHQGSEVILEQTRKTQIYSMEQPSTDTMDYSHSENETED